MGFEPLIVQAPQEREIRPNSFPQKFSSFKKMYNVTCRTYLQLLVEIFSSLIYVQLMNVCARTDYYYHLVSW